MDSFGRKTTIVAIVASFFLTGVLLRPAFANDGERLLKAIIGIGIGAAVDEARRKNDNPQRQQTHRPSRNSIRGPARSEAPDEKLSRSEMLQVQRALVALGYDIGKPDGVAGRKTGQAIADFLRGQGYDPYQTDIRHAQQMILDAGGQGADSASVVDANIMSPKPQVDMMRLPVSSALSGDGDEVIDWRANPPTAREDRAKLGREILRRIVKAEPQLLDDDEVLASWLKGATSGSWAFWPDPQLVELNDRFEKANEFDRPALLDKFGDFLRQQATDAPLVVVRVRRSSTGRYDFERGVFHIAQGKDGYDLSAEMDVDWGNRPLLEAIVPIADWPDISELVIPSEEAESVAARFGSSGSRYLDVALRMTLTNFRHEGAGSGSFVADAKVDRISVHYLPTDNSVRLGPIIGNLPTRPGEVNPVEAASLAGSALESWERLGAPAVDNRVILETSYSEREDPIRRPFELLFLRHTAHKPESFALAYYFARNHTAPAQFGSLFPGGDDRVYHLSQDEFARRDIVAKFDDQFLPALKSRAPQLPAKARLIWEMHLGSYDFDAARFPVSAYIQTGESSRGIEIRLPSGVLRTNLTKLPDSLSIAEAEARRLSAGRRRTVTGETLTVFAEADLDLVSVEGTLMEDRHSVVSAGMNFDGFSTAIITDVSRIAVYADRERSNLIQEFLIRDFQKTAPVVKPPTLAGSAVPKGTMLNSWNLVALAASNGPGESLTDAVIRSSKFYLNAQDDSRNDLFAAMKMEIAGAGIKGDDPIYLPTNVALSGDAARAAISGYSFQVEQDSRAQSIDPDLIAITIDNADTLRRLVVDTGGDKNLTSGVPVKALFRVRPTSGVHHEGGKPVAELRLRVDEILFLIPEAPDRFALRVKLEEPAAVAIADTGPNSKFSVLGIKLGMPVESAVEALSRHVQSASATPLLDQVDSTGSLTPCQDFLLSAKREGYSKDRLNAELRKRRCEIPEQQPLVFAFGYDLKLSDELTERIVVYRTGSDLGQPVVSGIYRGFSADNVGTLLLDGLAETYGEDFIIPNGASNTRIWADDPSQKQMFKANSGELCVPFWIGDHGFPAQSVDTDCGSYLRGEYHRMLLIDTSYASKIRREQAELDEAIATSAKPKIKF